MPVEAARSHARIPDIENHCMMTRYNAVVFATTVHARMQWHLVYVLSGSMRSLWAAFSASYDAVGDPFIVL